MRCGWNGSELRAGFPSSSPLSKPKSQVVKIANPHVGGATYTSAKKARELVKRGVASWSDEGVIQLLSQQWIRTNLALLRAQDGQRDTDLAIQANRRGGMVYWNGRGKPDDMARPGQRVS